jgi:hypothetical protein
MIHNIFKNKKDTENEWILGAKQLKNE